jgi:adenine phosphoribosyltransferase
VNDLQSLIRSIPDYPSPGITFFDITPVLGHGDSFAALLRQLTAPFEDLGITKVAGIEARGFVLAAPAAERLGAGFVPIRKPGKLPYDTLTRSYDLEYGTDALEIHVDAVDDGDRVLLVDDVIATGGTAEAAIGLLSDLGAEVVAFSVFIELGFLRGRTRLGENCMER